MYIELHISYYFLEKAKEKKKILLLKNAETTKRKKTLFSFCQRKEPSNNNNNVASNKNDKNKSSEEMVIYMILINGLDFIVLRLPKISIIIYSYCIHHFKGAFDIDSFRFNLNVLCYYSPFYLSDTLLDIVEIFFVLSLNLQVLIYYHFNRNLKMAFYEYFNIKIIKKVKISYLRCNF